MNTLDGYFVEADIVATTKYTQAGLHSELVTNK